MMCCFAASLFVAILEGCRSPSTEMCVIFCMHCIPSQKNEQLGNVTFSSIVKFSIYLFHSLWLLNNFERAYMCNEQ